MVRFQYVAELARPAPFVYVTVQNPDRDRTSGETPALLDSGADRTVIPGKMAMELGLSALRTLVFGGLGTDQHLLDTYEVFLQIRNLQPVKVEVAAHADESIILLGRDVLNSFRVVLDGPNQILEIG